MSYKKIGEGSYGCIIKPALPCHNLTKKNFVSKILKKSRKSHIQELKISKRLNKSKKFNVKNHFCTIKGVCTLKHKDIPKNIRHDDLSSVDKKCRNTRIDPKDPKKKNTKYISLLMENCGKKLFNKESLLFLKNNINLVQFIKHLLESLKYAKSKKIVLGDIKLDNMLLKNRKPILIDFGNSQIITSHKNLRNNINNIATSPAFSCPEIILLKTVLENIEDDAPNWENVPKLQENISYTDILKTINEDSYINEAGINGEIDSDVSSKNIGKKLKQYYQLFKSKKFTDKFLKNYRKEIIYKIDIYSLGRVLENIYDLLQLKNKKILGLINNMIELNHNNRFSVEECLDYMNK